MEVRRRNKRNKIINSIRDSELCITRSADTIKRIKSSNMGIEYISRQIEKLNNNIDVKKKDVEDLKEELLKVNSGQLDDDINNEYKNNKKDQIKNNIERQKAKKEKQEENKEKKEISKEYWKGIMKASHNKRQQEKDIKYSYKYLNKVIDTIPEYILKNLKEMPNNKGYIWRGVHLYGKLKEQKGPRVMFEKKKGGILIIHENTSKEYRKYEKNGKERKKLVFTQIKKPKVNSLSIMDYIKK